MDFEAAAENHQSGSKQIFRWIRAFITGGSLNARLLHSLASGKSSPMPGGEKTLGIRGRCANHIPALQFRQWAKCV